MAFIQKIKTHVMSRKVLFSVLAVAMLVLIIAIVVYSVDFLGTTLNAALTAGTSHAPVEKFDIQGFEALKLR